MQRSRLMTLRPIDGIFNCRVLRHVYQFVIKFAWPMTIARPLDRQRSEISLDAEVPRAEHRGPARFDEVLNAQRLAHDRAAVTYE